MKKTRRSNLGARREGQRPLIRPLKDAYTEYRVEADEAEQVIREVVEQKVGTRRAVFMKLIAETVKATSTVAVAEELGVTRQTVYRWMRELEGRGA